MCSDTKSNLVSLEDFVLNQDQIVTYKWLSKKLSIHANTSKQLLYSFAVKNAKEGLHVTHLICGSTEDGNKVMHIVSESEKGKVKSSLHTVLAEHVYSVQKACTSLSSSDLYLADSSSQSSDNKFSAISLRIVKEREFKSNAPEKPVDKAIPTTSCETLQQNVGASKSPVKSMLDSSPTKRYKTKLVQSKEGSISALFNKQADKKKNEPTPKETKNEDRIDKVGVSKSPVKSELISNKTKLVQSKEGSIRALFNKQAEKKKNEPTPKEPNNENRIDKPLEEVKKNVPMEEDKEPIVSFDETIEKSVVKTPVAQKKKSNKSSKKKRKNNLDDDNTPARKRKRIVLASDSESEDNEEEDVYMEEEPEYQPAPELPESEEEDEVIPPTPFGEKIKKRTRKQIDRIFTDEDGFIITKKEYVYVSCSDDETENNQVKSFNGSTPEKSTPPKEEPSHEAKKENYSKNEDQKEKNDIKKDKKSDGTKGVTRKQNSKRKTRDKMSPTKSSPEKNKQASIMSFFKKM